MLKLRFLPSLFSPCLLEDTFPQRIPQQKWQVHPHFSFLQDGGWMARVMDGQHRGVGSVPARRRRGPAWLRSHARRRAFLRPPGAQLLAMAGGPISRARIMKSIRRVQLSKGRYVVSARRCPKKVRRATVVRMSWSSASASSRKVCRAKAGRFSVARAEDPIAKKRSRACGPAFEGTGPATARPAS